MVTEASEGDVKKLTKKMLDTYAPAVWYFMCVPGGFGVSGIPDYVGLANGKFFGLETKRPGRRGEKNEGLSALQVRVRNLILGAGGAYFKVDDAESLKVAEDWIIKTF